MAGVWAYLVAAAILQPTGIAGNHISGSARLLLITEFKCTVGHLSFSSFVVELSSIIITPGDQSAYENSLLLALNQPASCSGVANAWEYCFFHDSSTSSTRAVSFAIYRPNQAGYVMVEESYASIDVLPGDYADGYHCETLTLKPFLVQERDVVGACLPKVYSNEMSPNAESLYVTIPRFFVHVELYSIPSERCSSMDIPRVIEGNVPTLISTNRSLNIRLEVESNFPSSTSSSMLVATSTRNPVATEVSAIQSSDKTYSTDIYVSSTSSSLPPVHVTSTKGTSVQVVPTAAAVHPPTHNRKSSSSDNSTHLAVAVAVLSIALAIVLVLAGLAIPVAYCVFRKRRTQGRMNTAEGDTATQGNQNNVELPEFGASGFYKTTDAPVGSYVSPAETEEGLYVQLQQQRLEIIPRKAIEVHLPIGHGHYGVIDQGYWHSSSENGDEVEYEVAIKSIRSGKDERVQLLREAAIMSQFHHPNILKLHGIVAESETVMLVLEIAHGGDLKKYIRSLGVGPDALQETSLKSQLFSFSTDIAAGMAYLSLKGFIHRNLAARNVLLSSSRVCKIGNFRMSRDIVESPYYRLSQGARIPVKWTAPEAVLHQKYSTASDVWSYGCVLYEIWSLGKDPFDNLTIPEVIDRMKQEYHHPPPPGSPSLIPEILMNCWQNDPHSRPNFNELVELIVESAEYEEMR